MISPIHIISIGLGGAFFLGFAGKKAQSFAAYVMLAAIAAMGAISAAWLTELWIGNISATQIFTAGFKPPYSINLLMGLNEAFLTSMINLVGFLGGLYLLNTLKKAGNHAIMVFLVFVMGLNVIVMTRDAFNLFVFMEIASISTAGMIIFTVSANSMQAGFKYLIATGVISGIYLLGVIFAYYFTGSLNIDSFASANLMLTRGGSLALMMILSSLILELKPFPANGWAIDVYEAAHPGIGALISAASATAIYYVLYKFIPLADIQWHQIITIAGLLTFVVSNLLGIQQKKAQRLLGYSSVGQLGLLISVLGLSPVLGDKLTFIAATILLSHYLAKAGLFWLAGIVKRENLEDWALLRSKPMLLLLFGTFIFTLLGFPPFPSFFGKWELILTLSQAGYYYTIAFILIGSFLESVYLFRWLGYAIKLDFAGLPEIKLEWNKITPVIIFGAFAYSAGFYTSMLMDGMAGLEYMSLLLFVVALYLIDFLPVAVKNTISIAGLAYLSYTLLPGYYYNDYFRFVFGVIFLIGGILTFIAGYHYKGKREGFYPSALTMYIGLAIIIMAQNTLHFFFGWELMTIGSYLLIIRGKRSMPHGYSYILFSVGGAYLILAGFGLAYADTSSIMLSALNYVAHNITVIFALIAVGLMTKMASLGLHIWLPGAHAEAESDVSPMVSAILLKAGVFGMLILMIAMGKNSGAIDVSYVLGWIAALTVLVGNMGAVFQEDAKRLLAYSSIGQLGYILFGLAMMSHLGWMTAVMFSINHFLYKAVLFLTIGAVVLRVGTHYMYKMGGLIKRMPLAFIAVLIGIIALSGIPPLPGFASKWLLYNAIVDKHWYFQGIIVLFSGIVAFLYLFKLIHSVFLGQLKDNLRNVKDISLWFAIPIYIMIAAIMVLSAKPDIVLTHIGNTIAQWYPQGALTWQGTMATSMYGYWDAYALSTTIAITFLLVLLWLWLFNRKPQRIEQFNIVYSGEVPDRPETTHISHNMYAGYNKALGWITRPVIERFWGAVSDFVNGLGLYLSKILYTGNGQTYVTYVVMYVIAFYFIMIY
jgi:formate hydrogenlyase subunit 3/multisubunit Na+/H+ antiporter MnhD subunit